MGLFSQGMFPDLASVAIMCHFCSTVTLMEKSAWESFNKGFQKSAGKFSWDDDEKVYE